MILANNIYTFSFFIAFHANTILYLHQPQKTVNLYYTKHKWWKRMHTLFIQLFFSRKKWVNFSLYGKTKKRTCKGLKIERNLTEKQQHHICVIAGAAEACGGTTGRQQLHDPPMIFDLQRDQAEETPLQVGTPEYRAIAEKIASRREELLWDIATDKSVSKADYNTDQSAVPCCDPGRPVCRCDTLCWGAGGITPIHEHKWVKEKLTDLSKQMRSQ